MTQAGSSRGVALQWRVPLAVCSAVLSLSAGAARAQSTIGELPEAVVSAPRGETIGGAAPLLELSPSELESYGVDTLSDLVDALKPLTRSSRSDQLPVILINGHLAGQVEFQNIPREAIERVEVLPETVALQYGFSENQRVLNFILRAHYRAAPTRLSGSVATEGGDATLAADSSLVQLEGEARTTLWASYKDNSWLRARQRGIEVPDSKDLTLQPAKTDATLAGTVSRSILGVSSSLEASLDAASSRSLQGLTNDGSVATAIAVPLEQTLDETTARIASQLTGLWGNFVWGATAFYLRDRSHSTSEIGFDADGELLADRTDSTLNVGNLQLSLSGPVLSLPEGPIIANVKFALQYQGFAAENAMPELPLTHSNLVRSDRLGNFNASVPLASHNRLGWLGDLSGTINVTLDNVSDFGTLWSFSYGLDWTAFDKIHLDAIMTDHRSAPSVQQVLGPPIFTPNVELFDFVKGETVFITESTGGTSTLQATDDRVASFGLGLGPFLGKTVFSAHYEQNRISNAIGALPPLTENVELAFPERFVRDADGTLAELDDRWVNLQRERVDDLRWGFNWWIPLGTPPAPHTMPNRFELSIFDTWYLRDTVLIRQGIPTLDLLNGAPSDVAGGQPRHKVEFRSLIYHSGIGGALSAAWRSATTVSSNDPTAPDTLFFSALGTVDFRVFADFEHIPATRNEAWAKGARLSLAVTNLFDQRQTVRDSTGATPVAFEPGYLDPAGRVVALSVPKVF